ncbi:MAG: TetR/AcrR family transcriptional regulator [Hyphomonadaceae bacterium]
MRLTKLTQRLNVSTGSFYHHFTDMDDYLSALAEYFRVDQVSRLVAELKRDFPNPVARIRQLAIESLKSGLLALDAPMRVWAASDERAAQSLRKVEHIVLSFLKEAFEEAGFAKADAELRAHVLLSVSVARLLTPYAGGGLREQTLRILLTRPPA